MDKVIVESSSGLIGVSNLIKAAMPELHPGSILRSVNAAMRNADRPSLTTKTVRGRKTSMASLDVCKYILDHMPGHRWVMWRITHGESFKESLSQHVEQARSTIEVLEDAEHVHGGSQEEELQETKASTLKKALRTLDIQGSARIHEELGEVSIIDVIRLQCPEASAQYSAQMLIRLLEKEDVTELGEVCNSANTSNSIASRVHYIQINGKGRATPVCDAKTIVEIIWLLPTSAARSFRRQSAETICRVLGGDVSLCGEIEEKCARLSTTSEGRSYQNFMMGGEEPAVKRTRIGPEIMELASEEQYAKYVKMEVDYKLAVLSGQAKDQHVKEVKAEVSLVMSLKDAFEVVGPLEARHKIELTDKISDIQKRASAGTRFLSLWLLLKWELVFEAVEAKSGRSSKLCTRRG